MNISSNQHSKALVEREEIRPLLKKTKKGTRYVRTVKISTSLEKLTTLPLKELLKLAKITNPSDLNYIPSECLMYFIRSSCSELSETDRQVLLKQLIRRVTRLLSKGIPVEEDVEPIIEVKRQTRKWVLEQLVDMILGDKRVYDDRLDYYEIRFNHALACLRRDKFKKAVREVAVTTDLGVDPETGELPQEVEQARGIYRPSFEEELEQQDYRSRLEAAINTLPPNQRTVITMIQEGYFMYSEDPTKLTIAKKLNKSPKTIYNYLTEARITLRKQLKLEGLYE